MIKNSFIKEASCGIMLIISAALAMLLANINITQDIYTSFLAIPIEFRFGSFHISKDMHLWINDALMSIFFLSIGLEVKREMVFGMLDSREKAIFPLIAALGGMIFPGLIFLLFNGRNEITRSGWAIPTATDIAFALGVLALLGNQILSTLKIFLMTLAIIDDLGAIIIIALFYTNHISMVYLLIASTITIVLVLLNYFKVYRISVYIILGIVLWMAILKSGIHATLAGVIVGFTIPLVGKDGILSPTRNLAHTLHPWINQLILPIFAFANAGISLNSVSVGDLFLLVPLGIILGLFIGKPLGISLFCWLGIRLGFAKLPQNTSLSDITAVGMLCGIGFTMSIFIASLAYGGLSTELIVMAKLGILSGSLISAVVGLLLLNNRLHKFSQ